MLEVLEVTCIAWVLPRWFGVKSLDALGEQFYLLLSVCSCAILPQCVVVVGGGGVDDSVLGERSAAQNLCIDVRLVVVVFNSLLWGVDHFFKEMILVDDQWTGYLIRDVIFA